MGNNVTTTPVETLKIDEINDIEDNDIHYNTHAINGSYDGLNVQTQNQYPHNYTNENWNQYGQQYAELNPNINQNFEEIDSSVNERIEQLSDSVPDLFTDESSDVLSEMKEPINDLNAGIKAQIPKHSSLDRGLLLLRRSIEDNTGIHEIDDLESIDSSSKLTLNDVRSDTEEVIQELNKLDLDFEDPSDRYPPNYRRRGQSWSNWDNTVPDRDLKAESSMSSFSRPNSINDNQPPVNGTKTKSYTAPESRMREDSAIEWLAKQHGLEIGSSLDHDIKHKSNNRTFNRNDLKLTSFEIPGSVVSLSSTTAENENEINDKYDDLEKQIINSIENDFMR